MSPVLALGVFRYGAQNFDAIGGTTDIDRPSAPIASEAYDPTQPRPGGDLGCAVQLAARLQNGRHPPVVKSVILRSYPIWR
jgi:hypothetical protein